MNFERIVFMPSYEEFSYTLEEEEIVKALRISGYYRISPKRMVIQTVLLLALFVFFLVSFFLTFEWFNLAMSVVCVVVMCFFHFVPLIDMKHKAKQAEKEIKLRLYPTVLYYYGKQNTTTIPLKQAKVRFDSKNEILSVMPQEGGFLAIPFRSLPKDKKYIITHQLLEYADERVKGY